MRGEEGATVEDSFNKIQEQDDNEEVSSIYFYFDFRKLTIVCYERA